MAKYKFQNTNIDIFQIVDNFFNDFFKNGIYRIFKETNSFSILFDNNIYLLKMDSEALDSKIVYEVKHRKTLVDNINVLMNLGILEYQDEKNKNNFFKTLKNEKNIENVDENIFVLTKNVIDILNKNIYTENDRNFQNDIWNLIINFLEEKIKEISENNELKNNDNIQFYKDLAFAFRYYDYSKNFSDTNFLREYENIKEKDLELFINCLKKIRRNISDDIYSNEIFNRKFNSIRKFADEIFSTDNLKIEKLIKNNYLNFIKNSEKNDLPKKERTIEELQTEEIINAKPHNLDSLFSNYLKDKKFRIPIYQRKYRWNEKLVVKLLIDIKSLESKSNRYSDSKNQHYLGNITLTQRPFKQSDNTWDIVDGQQRLSTLFLITKGLIYFSLEKFNNDFIRQIKENESINNVFHFFNVVNGTSTISQKFIRIDGNQEFKNFQKIWNDQIDPNDLYRPEKNLYKIIGWMEKNILTRNDLFSFWDSLIHDVIFILIEIKISDSFTLFERMNTGNEPLNAIELIKNKLIEHFEQEELEFDINKFQNLFEDYISKKFTKNDETPDNKKINLYVQILSNAFQKNINFSTEYDIYTSFWDYIDNNLNTIRNNYENIITEIGKQIDFIDEIKISDNYIKTNKRMFFIFDMLSSLTSGSKNNYLTLIRILLIKIIGQEKIFNFRRRFTHEEKERIIELIKPIVNFEIRGTITGKEGQSNIEKISNVIKELDKEINNEEIIDSSLIFSIFKDKFKNSNWQVRNIKDLFLTLKNSNSIEKNDAEMFLLKLFRKMVIEKKLFSGNRDFEYFIFKIHEKGEEESQDINKLSNFLFINKKDRKYWKDAKTFNQKIDFYKKYISNDRNNPSIILENTILEKLDIDELQYFVNEILEEEIEVKEIIEKINYKRMISTIYFDEAHLGLSILLSYFLWKEE